MRVALALHDPVHRQLAVADGDGLPVADGEALCVAVWEHDCVSVGSHVSTLVAGTSIGSKGCAKTNCSMKPGDKHTHKTYITININILITKKKHPMCVSIKKTLWAQQFFFG